MADREDIAYKSDLNGFVKGPSGATPQKIAVFGSESGTIEASTVSISDVPTEETIADEVETAVGSATSEIWNAVKGVDALQAYGSQEWGSGVSYEVGDFCRYDGTGYYGYKCKEAHTSGQSFDTSKWEGVLTDDGCSAIDEILSGYSTEGLASLLDLAPAWNSSSSVEYKVGQLVKKDGILQICTVSGHGVAATFSASGANVDASISERISALDTALRDVITQHTSNTAIHVTEEEKETWSGKQDAISDLSEIREDAEAGAAAAERDKVVISNGTVTAKHADDTGSVELASKSSVDGKADAVAIDDEYDTSSSGYAVGDTCTHGGKWYKCSTAVSTGAAWNASNWYEITVKEAIASGATTQEQADWTESDDTKPSYIKHKPTIPAATVIDDTLTQEGDAADAKAVGDAIDGVRADMVDIGKLPYEIKELLEVGSSDSAYDDAKETYRLLDRTVNVIETTINDNKTIALIPPAVPSASTSSRKLARDFYVVLLVDADNDVGVSMTSMSLNDCNEGSVTLYVPKGEHVTYRFTDADENQSVFLVTLFADPAIQKIRQIEKALDDILNGEGIVTPSRDGIMIYDVTDGKYHRMVAVTDEETGEVNISVDDEGVDL